MHFVTKFAAALLACAISLNAQAEIEEILVSIQDRQYTITEVPLSVSAITPKMLDELGINQLNQLQAVAPGLYISSNETSHPTYNIRGLSSGAPSALTAPRIAIYLNNADISRSRSSHIELHDMERIEVIKGPHSTLFGTAASAGAIAYYTAKPSAESYSHIGLTLGNFNRFDVSAVVNGGNDTLQGRLALQSRNRDGYIENQLANGQDLGSVDRLSIRPSLRWNINDNWQADLVLTLEESGDIINPNKSGIVAPAGGNTSPFSTAANSGSPVSSALFPRTSLTVERETKDANLRLSGNINHWNISAVSAYREFDATTPFDADGSQAHAFELLEQASGHQFSHEFRADKDYEQLSLSTALSYFTETNRRSNSFSADEGSYLMCVPLARSTFSGVFNQFAAFSPSIAALAAILDPINGLPCANPDGSINSLTPFATGGALQSLPYFAQLEDAAKNDSYSALIDLNYHLTDRLTVEAGLRYVYENRRSRYSAISPPAVLLQNLLPLLTLGDTNGQTLRASNSDSDVLLLLNSRYEWRDQHHIYAAYSQGRRSEVVDITSALDGNFQTVNTTTIVPAEQMENYELGLKGQSHSLYYSAAVFHQRYQDFQVGFVNSGGQFQVVNAGDTNNSGAELSLNWHMSDSIELFGHLSWFDRRLDDKASNGNFRGKAFENSSEKSATLGINTQHELGSHRLRTSLYGHYRSAFATDPTRQPNDPISGLSLSQAGFTVLNGSITLEHSDKLSISLWANNLSNKRYLSDISDIGANLGMPTYQAAEPRTFGIRFSISQ